MRTLGKIRMAATKHTSGTDGRRAISPVIATIILVAITIVIAIAVAGWVFGLFGSYSRTSSITVLASASSCSASSGCTIVLSNQGATAVTVVSASINGNNIPTTFSVTVSAGSTAAVSIGTSQISSAGVTLTPGQTVQIQIGLSNGNTVSTTLVVSS